MITIRKSKDRGASKLDWLLSYHSFSFADYHDPNNIGFRDLRVINDDEIAPSGGFATHGHRDMEIVTYVINGTLAHKDSIGNVETIKAGEVQRMSAGTGIEHSEFNYSDEEEVRLLQIWVLPEEKGIKPGYEQKAFSETEKSNNLKLLISKSGEDNSISIHQDIKIYASIINSESKIKYEIEPSKHLWVQVATGSLKINGVDLSEGDGAAISDEKNIEITTSAEAEFLLFDLK